MSSRSFLFFLFVFASAAFLLFKQWNNSIHIESSIFKLLPQTDAQTQHEITKDMMRKTNQRIIYLIGHNNSSDLEPLANAAYELMNHSKLFSSIQYRMDTQQQQKLYELYSPYWTNLLSKKHYQLLRDGHYLDFTQYALNKLYAPFGAYNSYTLQHDPLFTLNNFLEEALSNSSRLSPNNDLLTGEHNGTYYVLIIADLKSDVFSQDTQNAFKKFSNELSHHLSNNTKDVTILSVGAIHHAIAGTDSAKKDTSIIGIGSMIGIIAIVYFVFRSTLPILLASLSVFVGILIGFTANILLFDEIHIFTLVFGSSVIGLAFDYSLHFFARSLHGVTPHDTMREILPGLSMSLITTAIAFIALAFTNFPGLQQITVFSVFGITASYLVVILWLPSLHKPASVTYLPSLKPIAYNLNQFWIKQSTRKLIIYITVIGATLSITNIVFVRTNDDVRLLQNKSPSLLANESIVSEITGISPSGQFFISQGNTIEEVLIQQELLFKKLDQLIADRGLDSYQGIAKLVPSEQKQRLNNNVFVTAINSNNSPIQRYLEDLQPEQKEKSKNNIDTHNKELLKYQDWEKISTDPAVDSLKIQYKNHVYTGNVLLIGLKDLNAIESMPLPHNVFYIDYVNNITTTLSIYRATSIKMVVLSGILITGLLIFRYGIKHVIYVASPPILSILITLTISSLLGIEINYFNTLALILILGLGIDYAIILAESDHAHGYDTIGNGLSAITTILSFGLLGLSSTPVLQSFGIMIVIGVTSSFLLSPIALRMQDKKTNPTDLIHD